MNKLVSFPSTSALGAAIALALLSACGANPQTLVDKAKHDLDNGNAPAAISELRTALAKDSKKPQAWLLLADAALLQNDRATAEDSVEKARSTGASQAELAPREWVLMRLKGNYADLKRSVEKAGTSVPDAVRTRFMGEALMALHQPLDALAQYQRSLELTPGNPDAVVGLASAQLALGQSESGIKTLQDAMVANAKEPRFPVALAEIYMSSGKAALAEPLFATAAKLTSPKADTPTWIVAQSGLAQSALAQARYDVAHKAIHGLSAGAPHLLVTKLLQARLALGESRPAEAAAFAQAVVTSMPNDVQGHMLLAYATFQQGYNQQAETSLDSVLTEHPEYVPARKLLAEIQLATKRTTDAKHTLDPILGADADPDTLVLAGRIASADGDDAASTSFFNRALTSSAATDDLKYRVSLLYLKQGKREQATNILKDLPGGSELAKKRDLLLALSESSSNDKDGTSALDAVAKRYEGDPIMQRMVAQLHASRGDLDTARSQLNGILKANPDDIDTMLTLANVENTAKHPEVAEQILHQVLAKAPKNVAASMALARFALERGDMDAVALNLEAARAADPKAVEPRLSLARLYLNKIEKSGASPELLQAARGPLKEALAVAPKQVDVVLLSAQLEASSGHPEEAKDLLRNAATNDTASAPIWLELANLQIRAKETSKAYESLNQALAAHPAWLPAVRMIAALHVSEGDIDHALEATRKARDLPGLTGVEAAAQKSGALFLEAEVLSNAATKDPANAAKLWNQAATTFIQSYTTSPTLQAAMRVMQVRKFAKLPDADASLVTWVSSHPADLKARSALAQYYSDAGDRTKAIKVYEEGVAKGTSSAEQMNNLAWAYSENKDARALPTAQQALILSNRKPEVLDTVGWILVQDSKLSEALPYLQEAQKAAPHNPEIAYHAAYVLAHTGNTDAAKRLLSQLLLAPDTFPSRKLAEALNTNLSAAGH